MAQRIDPSSLSFGARVAGLEEQAVVNARRVKELEANQSTKAEKDLARELQKSRRAERQRATAMIASYETTAEELGTLDTGSLTTAQQQLVTERVKQLAFESAAATPFKLSFDASRRIENWRKLTPQNPTTAWGKNNTQPGFTAPLSNYERWVQNNTGRSGRAAEMDRLAHAAQMSLTAAKDAYALKPKQPEKSNGYTLGRLKDI